MKPYELNRRSWHFQLASRFGGLATHDDIWGRELSLDFCAYIRCVAWAIITITFVGGCAAFLGFCIYDLGHWVIECIKAGRLITLQQRLAGLLVYTLCALLFIATIVGGIIGTIKLLDWGTARTSNTEPGFIRHTYRALRHKTCVRIIIKD